MNKLLSLVTGTDLYKVVLVIFLFVLMFAPPVIPHLNITIILAVISLIFLMTRHRKDALDLIKSSVLKSFIIVSVAFISYLAVVLSFALLSESTTVNSAIVEIYRFFLICPAILSCVIFFILECRKRGYDFYAVLKMVLWAGLIQVAITMAAIFIPEIKNILISIMSSNTGNPVYQDQFFLERRGFGFANDLQDGFGYGIAILAAVPLLLAFISKKPSWLLFTPVVMIEALVNGRTGLVIAIFTIVPILLFMITHKKIQLKLADLRKYLLSVSGVVVISVATIVAFSHTLPSSYEMVVKDLNSVVTYTLSLGENQQKGTTAGNLFGSNEVRMPNQPTQLLFGTGSNVFVSSNSGFRTDIGYINDIWLVGVVGSALMYLPLLILLRGLFRVGGIFRVLALSLLLAFIVFQIKGRGYIGSLGMTLTLLLAFSSLYLCKTLPVGGGPTVRG